MTGWFPPGRPRNLGFSRTSRILPRLPSAPPRSDRMAMAWTPIVTSSRFLDPRSPPRPRSLEPVRSDLQSPLGRRGRLLHGRPSGQKHRCTRAAAPPPGDGPPGPEDRSYYYPPSATANGSSGAVSLNKSTSEHVRPRHLVLMGLPGRRSGSPRTPSSRGVTIAQGPSDPIRGVPDPRES